MDGDLLLLAVIGTAVALAALFMSQLAGLKRDLRGEIAGLRHEVNSLGNRVARLEGMIDMIQMGMQLPRPVEGVEEIETT